MGCARLARRSKGPAGAVPAARVRRKRELAHACLAARGKEATGGAGEERGRLPAHQPSRGPHPAAALRRLPLSLAGEGPRPVFLPLSREGEGAGG
jgi:hypothetical protein